MIEVEVCRDYKVSMAHSIKEAYDVKCRNLHGHNYKITICLNGELQTLPKVGYYIDFTELDELVRPVIDRLDHKYLNDFVGENASAERLAEFLSNTIPFGDIERIITTRGVKPISYSITVQENDRSTAKYTVTM